MSSPFVIDWERLSSTVPFANKDHLTYGVSTPYQWDGKWYYCCLSKIDEASSGQIIRTEVDNGVNWDILYDDLSFLQGIEYQDLHLINYGRRIFIWGTDIGLNRNRLWRNDTGGTGGGTWVELAQPSFSRRYGVSVVWIGQPLFMGGGSNDVWVLDDWWYGAGSGTWRCVNASAPWSARSYAAAIYYSGSWPNSLWLIGGSGQLQDVWKSFDDGVSWSMSTDSAPLGLGQISPAVSSQTRIWTVADQSLYYTHYADGSIWTYAGNITGYRYGLSGIPTNHPDWEHRDNEIYRFGGYIPEEPDAYVCDHGTQDFLSSSSSSSQSSSSRSSLSSFPFSSSSSSSSQSSLSSSSSSLSSSSQSEWHERIKDFMSIDIDPDTGDLILVAMGTPRMGGGGESAHVALFRVNGANDSMTGYKVLPKRVTDGDAFVLQRENSTIPFAWDAVEPRGKSLELPFSFGKTENILISAENYIFSEKQKQDVIIPNGENINGQFVNSQHSRLVDVGVWSDDTSGISEIKIGSVVGTPFDEFKNPDDKIDSVAKMPVFSWETNPSISQQTFVSGDNSGNIRTYNFFETNNRIVLATSTSLEKSPIKTSPINSIISDGRGFYWTSNQHGILKIDASKLSFNTFVYDVANPVVSCVDDNQNIYVIAEDGNQIVKISSSMEKTYIKGFSGLNKAIWSQYHNSVIAMSEKSIYQYDGSESKLINQMEKYSFYDVDVHESGLLATILSDGNDSIIKVLNNDFTLRYNINIEDSVVHRCVFAKEGYLAVSVERLGGDSSNNDRVTSSVLIVKLTDETFSQIDIVKNVVAAKYTSLLYNDNIDSLFLFSSSGKNMDIRYRISDYWVGNRPKRRPKVSSIIDTMTNTSCIVTGSPTVKKIKHSDQDESTANETSATTRPSAVRVFVGSRQGLNDMWDSGIINTGKTSILYGGGNNLKHGYRYFVNVVVRYGYNYYNVNTNKMVNKLPDVLVEVRAVDGDESAEEISTEEILTEEVIIQEPTWEDYQRLGWRSALYPSFWGNTQTKEFTVPK
jgi:hypothetical protein